MRQEDKSFASPLAVVPLSADATRIAAAAGDIVLQIDRDGIIRGVDVPGESLAGSDFSDLIARRLIDAVTVDSRNKAVDLLGDAAAGRRPRWREVNLKASGGAVPLSCVCVPAADDGRILALGRDLSAVAALQGRLQEAQQALERDYAKLRQAETRYRVLFQTAGEAVLIIDPVTRRVQEANPAAAALMGESPRELVGRNFERLIHPEHRDRAIALLATPPGPGGGRVPLVLAHERRACTAGAALFRNEGVASLLVNLEPSDPAAAQDATDPRLRLLRVINRIPDAFVLADETMGVIDANLAFLELAQLPGIETARGQKLARFLGRPGADLRLLGERLREQGWVRNYRTQSTTLFGDTEEVEVTAVLLEEGMETTHGFVIRPVRSGTATNGHSYRLPHSPDQLIELVGRVPMKDIVSETTDVIERMCIEAALAITNNNRASAAEILGVSRQSLYAKLNRYQVPNRGFGRQDDDHDPES